MTSLKEEHEGCTSHVEIEAWSDERCIKISEQDTFPAAIKDLQIQRKVVSCFLNFYLGGKVQKGLNTRDLIFATIAIMPVSLASEEFIWHESEYSEKGHLFFLSPDDKLSFEMKGVIYKTTVNDIPHESNEVLEINSSCILKKASNKEYYKGTHQNEISKTSEKLNKDVNMTLKSTVYPDEKLLWFTNKGNNISSKKKDTSSKSYGPVENASFCIACNHLLDQWESSVKARTTLKYFFAMAALVAMRCRVKSIQNITKYFATKFFENLVYLKEIPYTTPHEKFIKKCWRTLRETDQSTQIMFAKLVIKSFDRSTTLKNYYKDNILRYAVLSHAAEFGMGVISMLQLIATETYEFKCLFDCLYSEETAVSWNRVNDFFKMYMCQGTNQFTFHWACIIETDQFQYMSCKNNYELAVVLAVFIEKLTKDSGVWRSKWVSSGKNLETLKQLGCRLYKDYLKKKACIPSQLQIQFTSIK